MSAFGFASIGQTLTLSTSQYSAELKKAKAEARVFAKDTESAMGRVHAGFSKLTKVAGLAAGAAGLGGVYEVAKHGIEYLNKTQQANAQTAATLHAMGKEAFTTTGHIRGLSESISKRTGVDVAAIQSSQNLILTMGRLSNATGTGKKHLDAATQAAVDLGVRMGTGPVASAKLLAKALADPEKASGKLSRVMGGLTQAQQLQIKALESGLKPSEALTAMHLRLSMAQQHVIASTQGQMSPLAALRKAHITLTAAQQKTFDGMLKGGRVAAAQALVIKDVESKVKGAASAFGKTAAGQIARAKESFDELSGTIISAVLPTFTKIIAKVQTLVARLQAWTKTKAGQKALHDLSNEAKTLFAWMGKVGNALVKTAGFLLKHSTATKAAAIAVAGLFAAWKAYQVISTAITIIKSAWLFTQALTLAMKGQEVATYGLAAASKGAALGTFLFSTAQKAATAGQWLWNAATAAWPGTLIVIGIAAVVAAVILLIKYHKQIWKVVVQVWDAIKHAVSDAASYVINWVKGHWVLLAGILGGPIALAAAEIIHHWGAIKSGAQTAWNGIKSIWGQVTGFFSGIGGKITNAASGMWNGITSAFRSAINGIIDIWNGLSFKIPGVHIPGIGSVGGTTISTPDISHVQRGGFIGGRGAGDIIPAMLEPGEGVLNRNAVAALGGPAAIGALNAAWPRFQTGGIAGETAGVDTAVSGILAGAGVAGGQITGILAGAYLAANPNDAYLAAQETSLTKQLAGVVKGDNAAVAGLPEAKTKVTYWTGQVSALEAEARKLANVSTTGMTAAQRTALTARKKAVGDQLADAKAALKKWTGIKGNLAQTHADAPGKESELAQQIVSIQQQRDSMAQSGTDTTGLTDVSAGAGDGTGSTDTTGGSTDAGSGSSDAATLADLLSQLNSTLDVLNTGLSSERGNLFRPVQVDELHQHFEQAPLPDTWAESTRFKLQQAV